MEKLIKKAGKVLEIRITGNTRGDYIRVRARHDVREPLTKFVSIVHTKQRQIYSIRYEKLARLCRFCGVLGHDHKECGSGIHDEKDLKFGDWLYADPPVRGRVDFIVSVCFIAVECCPSGLLEVLSLAV